MPTTKKEIKAIETWLPEFPGFYSTLFESDYGSELDWLAEEHNFTNDELCDIWGTDTQRQAEKDYREEVAKSAVDTIAEWLKKYVYSIEFQSISSPREYNFHNDSINVAISPNKPEIMAFLQKNKEAFTEYIEERYTDKSGFYSSYSNNVDDWLKLSSLDHKHKLGSILQFIVDQVKEDDDQFYYEVMDTINTPYLDPDSLRADIKKQAFERDRKHSPKSLGFLVIEGTEENTHAVIGVHTNFKYLDNASIKKASKYRRKLELTAERIRKDEQR